MLGRPKVNQRKDEFEVGSNGRLIKRGRKMTCQYCFRKDHNKGTYPVRKTLEKEQLRARGERPHKLHVSYTSLLFSYSIFDWILTNEWMVIIL